MSNELLSVVVRGLPLEIHREAESHAATVRRELALVHTADVQGEAPARLLWLSHHLRRRYAQFTTAQTNLVAKAHANNEQSIDLRFELPAHAADAAEQLARALEEVDAYCRTGDLVTLAASDQVLAYQRWFLEQFTGQLRDGQSPVSWGEWARARAGVASSTATARAGTGGDDTSHPRIETSCAATIVIDEDLDLEGSAAVRSELVRLLEGDIVVLTVDLSECAFIDSVGVSLLLTTLEKLEHTGGRLRVVGATGRTKMVLQTSGVLDILTGDS